MRGEVNRDVSHAAEPDAGAEPDEAAEPAAAATTTEPATAAAAPLTRGAATERGRSSIHASRLPHRLIGIPAVIAAVLVAACTTAGPGGSGAPASFEADTSSSLPIAGSTSLSTEFPAAASPPVVLPQPPRDVALGALRPQQVATLLEAGSLLAVSPDGGWAVVEQASDADYAKNMTHLVALSLVNGEAVDVGTAGWQDQGDPSVVRLVRPAWSSDSKSLAYGTAEGVSVFDFSTRTTKTVPAVPDSPISALPGGGFGVATPSGPVATGGAPASLAPTNDIIGPVFLGGGDAAVGLNQTGGVSFIDSHSRQEVAPELDTGEHPWYLADQVAEAALFGRSFMRGTELLLVRANGSILLVPTPGDACSGYTVSDDVAYLAYEACDQQGERTLRIEDLATGAAVSFTGAHATSPRFIAGSHRLTFLAIGSIADRTSTLAIATQEVLP